MNNKAFALTFNVIIFAILAVMVLFFVYIGFIAPIGGKGEQVGGLFGQLKDFDGDELRWPKDRCPCTFAEEKDGCPKDWTSAQRGADRAAYESRNSDTGCGKIVDKTPVEDKKEEEKEKTVAFTKYRTLELHGTEFLNNKRDGTIRQACIGWVGSDCHSEDDNCDGKFSKEKRADGCWIFASYDFRTLNSNACGQYLLEEGALILASRYSDLRPELKEETYYSPDGNAPKRLFQWSWKSTPSYGSLVCKEGFWQSCKRPQEGQKLTINGKTYTCRGAEWQ